MNESIGTLLHYSFPSNHVPRSRSRELDNADLRVNYMAAKVLLIVALFVNPALLTFDNRVEIS